jgi:hypothetical protein
MRVDFSSENLKADAVWFDASTGRLCVRCGDFVGGIGFAKIPDHDFESTAPVHRFSIGQEGSVVICHHRDGVETWLPVDMWLPDGFEAAFVTKQSA